MTPLNEVIIVGKAPEETLNVSTHDAITIKNYFEKLFDGTNSRILGLFINTTVPSESGSASMVNIKDVDPHPGNEMKFYFQLSVESPTLPQRYWEVSSIYRSMDSGNLETMTRKYMAEIDSGWIYLNFTPTYNGIVAALNALFVKADDAALTENS